VRFWLVVLALFGIACDDESFTGPPSADAASEDSSGTDATTAADAATPDASIDARPRVQITCGSGDYCEEACCYDFDSDAGPVTVPVCQPATVACVNPKSRFLCDDAADCAALGFPGYRCCGDEGAPLPGTQCQTECQGPQWHFCNNVNPTECQGDPYGPNCRPIPRVPIGYYACQP
jgi:hypothetical protein